MKRLLSLFFATFFIVCGGVVAPIAPSPTADIAPTQTRAAEIAMLATQTRVVEVAQLATAMAPTATPPPPTSTPLPTPSPTLAPTATPIPPTATAVPTPTPIPTVAPTAASATESDDDQFRQYLQGKFGTLGGRGLGFEAVRITHLGSGASASSHVSFDVDLSTTRYLDEASKAELQAWGEALIGELKARWPNRPVFGSLGWTTYSTNISSGSDCVYQSDSYTRGRGWYTTYYHVKVNYSPSSRSGNSIRVCGGK